MAGIVIPVSLSSKQANLIMELINRRVAIIENIHREAGVMTDETKQQRDALKDLRQWIWDYFGNEIEKKNLPQ